ncbi:hypothetical protein DFH09DRAFT_1355928 [Mycena vulgaris]|nr:hypothetical protein DFH09DRAFT_1355928 [Mycena vulgaris]
MDAAGSSVSLPPEIWIQIHRLATADTSPLAIAHSDRVQYVPVADPLQDMQDFLRNAYSFVLVCRLWNGLANEIMYENIRIDDRFPALYTALKRPGTPDLVRSIRLSPTRFDHSYAILALCPRVQIIVQPDPSNLSVVRLEAGERLELPAFNSLKYIYWTESLMLSGLSNKVFRAVPNLEYLHVSRSSMVNTFDSIAFPAILGLKRLGMAQTVNGFVTSSILQMDLQHLTRLQCAPSTVSSEDFPTLPSLHTLELFGSGSNYGSRSKIRFHAIFSRCPRLRELRYDVWNRSSPPRDVQSSLSCIRLHSAVSGGFIDDHFGLFLTPGFPRIQRIVLYGSWDRVVADAKFTWFQDGLRELGCRLEFPEGCDL